MILQAVGALFKSGGYRSFANYLSAAKAMHIEAGHEWTQLLAHTATWVTRSVLCGIGPSRQSCSFLFVRLCGLDRLPDPSGYQWSSATAAPRYFGHAISLEGSRSNRRHDQGVVVGSRRMRDHLEPARF